MNTLQYQTQVENLQGQSPEDLLAKIKDVLPFQEDARLVFGVYKKEGIYFLRLSPIGVAFDEEKETEAMNYLFVNERIDDLFIARREKDEFLVNFGIEGFGQVYKLNKLNQIKIVALKTPKASEAAIQRRYDKKAVFKALRSGLSDPKKEKQSAS